MRSIKLLLFIEPNECLASDYSFTFRVAVKDHLSDFSRSHIFFELLRTGNQILRGDETFIVLINITKNSFYLIFSILVTWMSGHQFDKLFETNLTALVGIEVGHCDVDKTSGWVVSSIIFDSFTEVKGSQHAVMIVVQVVEYLLVQLNILLVCFGGGKLCGVEIYISFRISKTAFHFLFGCYSSIFAHPEWPVASAILARISAHVFLL